MEHSIVYISSSAWLYSEEDLEEILISSRKNNQKLGVTGVLMYLNGSIIQVLEGEKDVIETLYKKIQGDERHGSVITLLSIPVKERLFSEWLMGYKLLSKSELKQIQEFTPFSENLFNNPQYDSLILSTVQTFFNNNIRN